MCDERNVRLPPLCHLNCCLRPSLAHPARPSCVRSLCPRRALPTRSPRALCRRAAGPHAISHGDLGIAARLFSPPARKYSLIVDRDGTVLPRQSEVLHQALSVLVHAIAPVAFAGYAVAALRADNGTDRALQTSLVAQALASVAGYLAIAVYFSGLVHTSRTVFGIGSNLLNKLCCVSLITQDLGDTLPPHAPADVLDGCSAASTWRATPLADG